MLTKSDLKAIKTIVDSSVGPAVGSAITSSEGRLRQEMHDSTSKIVSTLRAEMNKNTQELVDLITTGFHISDNHEVRISQLENKVFKSN